MFRQPIISNLGRGSQVLFRQSTKRQLSSNYLTFDKINQYSLLYLKTIGLCAGIGGVTGLIYGASQRSDFESKLITSVTCGGDGILGGALVGLASPFIIVSLPIVCISYTYDWIKKTK